MGKTLSAVARKIERRMDSQAGPMEEFFVTVYRDTRDEGVYHWKARKNEVPVLDSGWEEVFTISDTKPPLELFNEARRECERRRIHVPGLTVVQGG